VPEEESREFLTADHPLVDGAVIYAAMNPLNRPQPWVRLTSVVALLAALWLCLVPRTVSFFRDSGSATEPSGSPYDISVLYSWGTSDSQMIFSSALLDPDAPDALVTGIRADCGTGFTAGDNEGEYGADAACSDMETPRLIGGLLLAVLGTAGLVGARRLPERRAPAPS
jgi:hypothetical protein